MEEFLERYSLPRVVRISYKTLFSNETLQSSSSNTSTNTTTSNSSSSAKHAAGVTSGDTNMISSNSNSNTGTASSTGSSGLGGVGSGIAHTTAISQTLGSNSSNNSAANKSITNDGNHTTNDSSNHNNDEEQGELFLLYRLVRQRHIYHGHNSKSTAANRKKGVMIPQEFPGKCQTDYFSLKKSQEKYKFPKIKRKTAQKYPLKCSKLNPQFF